MERSERDRAQKTYRFPRIGMIGAAVMLAVFALIERLVAQCPARLDRRLLPIAEIGQDDRDRAAGLTVVLRELAR